jgi:hypothetical protein
MLLTSLAHAGVGIDTLDEGTGVRAAGMGGAMVAVDGDISAPAFNPAGLASCKRPQAMSSSTQLFGGDLSRFALDGVYPIWDGVAGLNFIQEGVNDILLTSADSSNQPVINGSFTASYRCLNFAYAKQLDNKTYVGGNFKYLSAELNNASASGFGLDLGVWRKLEQGYTVGAVAKNILPVSLGWSTGAKDEIPLKIVIGFSYVAKLWDRNILLVADSELIVKNRPAKQSFGLEYTVSKDKNMSAVVRLGYNKASNITAGLGLSYQDFRLDYAYQDHSLGSSSQIALGYLI